MVTGATKMRPAKARASVAEAKGRFFRDLAATGRSQRTQDFYSEAIDQFYHHVWAGDPFRDPRKVTSRDVQAFLISLRKLKRKDSTVQARYRALHRFFGWQVARRYIDKDPMADVTKPRVTPRVIIPYTDGEVRAMLEATRRWNGTGLRDQVIIELLYNTGMRAGELCLLRPQDVHAGRIIVTGKGKKERWLSLDDTTETHLRLYMTQPSPLTKALFGLSVSGLQQLIYRVAQLAGVPGAHVHRFRHTFACAFLRNGGQVTQLRKILGHANIETTMIYIAYIDEEMAGDAMRKFAPFAQRAASA
jgi:site-specific recombinase XerD